jgi:voltage-gated potassium channel
VRLRRPLGNPVTTILEGPPSVRHAIRLIVAATVVATFLGGVLMWVFDREDFGSFGDAMWWAVQTVTTVGYGDATPTNAVGRLIGAAVLLYAVAFLAILTAAITTSFVERARQGRRPEDEPDLPAVLDELHRIAACLDRLEQRSRSAERDDTSP